jgi:hypothetical protein
MCFFALICSFFCWGDLVCDSVVIYTDNNGVRDALGSFNTGNAVAKKVLVATLAFECDKQLAPWYARIPADSNIADGPSKLSTEYVRQVGAEETCFNVGLCWGSVNSLNERWEGNQESTQSHL